MSWASELPSELLCQPMGLVVLTGLDVTFNAIHKAIWDCFCNNRRPDRVPLQFRVMGIDHEYPQVRSKQRTSYEWYIPKGMLKTGWMRKHLESIPAVVVVFFDLDWDEGQWKERQMECATKVQIVRDSLGGRSTRVAVVLIQKTAPLPPGEDVVAAERAASLCSACDLSAKSLFVLPHTDHLLGYTIRLENAFYELAQSYYHTEARRVKAHKEFLNKTTHQLLFVRHQFKIAFYNELKQDTHTALKHYKQAYGHALDLRMHDTNLLEIKTIAGFINYKICRLSFQHNAPLDAIAQFRKHIDFFKNKVGIKELAFEHSAWMSKQFQVFGDLFDEAIKLGLPAIQTQHPGFYYQQAGNHSASRKQLCRTLCNPQMSAPTPDPLEHLNNLDYYGQRPWRQGHQSIDPPDMLKERDGITGLQLMEIKVDHSWIVIPLLTCAVAQFKKYKSPRMKRYLMVQMGEEYYHAKDYTKALTLLGRVTWDYRSEHWWLLLTNILMTSLRCAYLVASIQDYVTNCVEVIGTYTLCPPDERTRIQTNLIHVMSGRAPEPEPGCDAECVDNAKKLWFTTHANASEPRIFTIEMQNIIPFIECKACFTSNTFTAEKQVVLKVFLRSTAPLAMRFSKLSVLLNNQAYNQYCVVKDEEGMVSCDGAAGDADAATGDDEDDAAQRSDLYLAPNCTRVHTFSFLPQAEDVNKMLEITSIALEVGSDSSYCAILHWIGGGGDAVAPSNAQQMSCKPRQPQYIADDMDWEDIQVIPVTRVEPRVASMDITLLHEPPSLVNEFYQVSVLTRNEEQTDINNVRLSFGLKEGQDTVLEQATHVVLDAPTYDGHCVPRLLNTELGVLSPGQEVEKVLFIKSLQTGDRTLFAKVNYDIMVETGDKTIKCTCQKQSTIILPTVTPLDIAVRLTSLQFEEIDSVHSDEPFLLHSDLTCSSPWPLTIQTSQIELSSSINLVDEVRQSQVEGVALRPNDCASECTCLSAPPTNQATVPIGTFIVHWKRKSGGDHIPFVSTSVVLPTVTVTHMPIYVEVDIPAFGHVRACLPVTYIIHNRTPYSQEIEVTMETSDAFMFSGHKQIHFRILPNTFHKLTYSMYPLLPGNVLLPKLHLHMQRYPGTMGNLVQKMIPTHVYIKPSGKKDGYIRAPQVGITA